MPKVVSFSPVPEGVVRSLFAGPAARHRLDLKVVVIDAMDMGRIREELADADCVIGDYSLRIPITAEMVEAMPRVRLIQQPSTGYDHIDVEACRRRGIPVANIGGANTNSVAEHTIALALILLRRILHAHERLLRGEWAQGELMEVAADLEGKTWGIVGLGRIGRAVAQRVGGLGATVIYHDVAPLPGAEAELGVAHRPLVRLLSEADVVSLHLPLTPSTRGLLGERELRMMRPTALLINPSRGELVDEAALARAVREGWIAGAGVDVFSTEPPPPDHPLLAAAREGYPIVVTPHIAGATADARLRIIQVTVENVLRVLLGGRPENVVNP